MNNNISFPAIVINRATIDKINYKHLVCDKRILNSAFRHVLIVDSLGKCFDIEKVIQSGGINLFYSLRLIGIMVKVEPVLNKPVYEIAIEELKNILIEIIRRNPANFLALNSPDTLIAKLKSCSSFKEVVDVF
jgi:hypothetical protein